MAADKTGRNADRHAAGVLDIRNIIGGLLGVYGVVLVLMGLFGDTASSKTGGWNANLWTGVALVVFGAVFITWARLKPLMVPETTGDDDSGSPGHSEAG